MISSQVEIIVIVYLLVVAVIACLAIRGVGSDRKRIASEMNEAMMWADRDEMRKQADYKELLLPGMTNERKKIVLALADSDLDMKLAAERLYINQNVMDFNVDRIKQLTGQDPATFYGLFNLILWMKEMEESNGKKA